MSDDLISREALKKKIVEVQYTQEFCIEHKIDYSVSMQMLGMVIDNAPTVDVETQLLGAELHGIKIGYEDAQKKLIQRQGYECGYAQGYIDGQTGADYDERVRE